MMIACVSVILVSCTTTTFLEDFSRLQLDMDKADTLENVGPPSRKEFRDEKDWWYYNRYDQGEKVEKLVVFKQGRLIYAGKVAANTSIKDADTVDKENARKNDELDAVDERARVGAVQMNSAPTPIQDDTPPPNN